MLGAQEVNVFVSFVAVVVADTLQSGKNGGTEECNKHILSCISQLAGFSNPERMSTCTDSTLY
ncbi:hypothetical protein PILCRDRAFT_828508 [Piloderma croceum F 1598]|uniref:Uncharacterized protein n=1 Tax=Piloderma croceum (strain F 1598) TaxID=765440 RepID=A0A0C3F210_PILCF|nr:hypothetical protein PILCRDRAFT_828508 [Piloderma croceum F 1598]